MKIFSRNSIALIVTVVVHIVALIGLARVRPIPPHDAPEYRTTWITIKSDKPKVERARKKLEQQSDTTQSMEREAPSPRAPIAPVAITRIDWHAEGAQAVSDVLTRRVNEDARHAFSSKRESDELVPKSTKPDPIFSQSIHKRGDTERFDDGELATWIDNRCYATNKDFGEQRTNANTVVLVCKGNVGKPPIRRDMFDHLKPDYLHVPESPQSKTDPDEMPAE